MAVTIKDLRAEVDKFNEKYCRNTSNYLCVSGAYGGYQVQLTGKRRKDGKGYRGIGSGVSSVTYGYQSARETLYDLWQADSQGYVKSKIRSYERAYKKPKR